MNAPTGIGNGDGPTKKDPHVSPKLTKLKETRGRMGDSENKIRIYQILCFGIWLISSLR